MTNPLQPDRAEALGKAQTLADALNGMSAQLAAIAERIDDDKAASESRDKQLGRRVWRVIAAVAFDVALSVAVIVIALVANSANTAATAANNRAASATVKAAAASAAATAQRAASVASCEQGNQIRAQQRELNQQGLVLWGSLRSMPKTAAQAQAITKFQAKIKAADVQRNCVKVYTAPKAVPANGTS